MAVDEWEVLTPYVSSSGLTAQRGLRIGGKLYALVDAGSNVEVAEWSPVTNIWEKVGDATIGSLGDIVAAGDTIFFQADQLYSFNTSTGLFGGPHNAHPLGATNFGPKWYYHNGLLWQFGGNAWGDVHTYDPIANTWMDTGQDQFEVRYNSNQMVHRIGNKVYMHPGRISGGGLSVYDTTDWYVFDLVTETLSRLTANPTGFSDLTYNSDVGIGSDGSRYALYVGGHNNNSSATSAVHLLDYQDGSFRTVASHPDGSGVRRAHTMRLGDNFYTIGNIYGGASSYFCRYIPDVSLATEVGEFTGTDGPTIAPAPEKMPHVITTDDVGGSKSLQRKLQENFDSIERQLLALDPDNQDSKDPRR